MSITAISAGSHHPAVPKDENYGKVLELMDWTSGRDRRAASWQILRPYGLSVAVVIDLVQGWVARVS